MTSTPAEADEAALAVVHMWTDGACKGNPGVGGWGVVLRSGDHERHLCGGEMKTTNNQMELTAAIEGLRALKRPCAVTAHVDASYVKDGITSWIPGWKRNGWRTRSKEPVKNVELWRALDAEINRHDITWVWVRGHSGDPGNGMADLLANRGVDGVRASGTTSWRWDGTAAKPR